MNGSDGMAISGRTCGKCVRIDQIDAAAVEHDCAPEWARAGGAPGKARATLCRLLDIGNRDHHPQQGECAVPVGEPAPLPDGVSVRWVSIWMRPSGIRPSRPCEGEGRVAGCPVNIHRPLHVDQRPHAKAAAASPRCKLAASATAKAARCMPRDRGSAASSCRATACPRS